MKANITFSASNLTKYAYMVIDARKELNALINIHIGVAKYVSIILKGAVNMVNSIPLWKNHARMENIKLGLRSNI